MKIRYNPKPTPKLVYFDQLRAGEIFHSATHGICMKVALQNGKPETGGSTAINVSDGCERNVTNSTSCYPLEAELVSEAPPGRCE